MDGKTQIPSSFIEVCRAHAKLEAQTAIIHRQQCSQCNCHLTQIELVGLLLMIGDKESIYPLMVDQVMAIGKANGLKLKSRL